MSMPHGPVEFTAPIALVADLVQWVAVRPRTYRETMEAWRTSCPRLPVWEDTIRVGFLRIENDDTKGQVVVVTQEGRAFLEGHSLAPSADAPASPRPDASAPPAAASPAAVPHSGSQMMSDPESG